MALRWTAAGLIWRPRTFRRLKAYRQLPILRNALQEHLRKAHAEVPLKPSKAACLINQRCLPHAKLASRNGRTNTSRWFIPTLASGDHAGWTAFLMKQTEVADILKKHLLWIHQRSGGTRATSFIEGSSPFQLRRHGLNSPLTKSALDTSGLV